MDSTDGRDAGVHTLPITVEYGDREIAITPTVVETDRGLVVIDVGPAGAVDAIQTHLRSLGYALEDIWLVLVTHHDGDHVGGLAELKTRVDAVVAAHSEAAPYIRGDQEPIKGDGDRYPPVTVDLELTDGVRVPTVVGPLELIATPGHTPGHCSVYVPDGNLLIAGDALVSDGEAPLSGPKPEFTPDMDRALESVADLATLDIDHVVCYHGGYVEDGTERIQEIAETAAE